MHGVKTPRSIKAASRRLRIWRWVNFVFPPALGGVVGATLTRPTSMAFVVALVIFVIVVGWNVVLTRQSPARVRWLKYSARRSKRKQRPERVPIPVFMRGEPPSIAESFEIDLPCAICSAANIGTEAGEWHDRAVFRTCDTCGSTQWWTNAENPPRVQRRERPVANQRPREACVQCGYALSGIPLREEDRGSGEVVFVQQCPECGRAEIVVPRPAIAPPKRRRSHR